jgi:hypothetical protein
MTRLFSMTRFAIGVGMLALILGGCGEPEGPAKKAGKALDQTGKKIKHTVNEVVDMNQEGPTEKAGKAIDEAVTKTQESMNQAMGKSKE